MLLARLCRDLSMILCDPFAINTLSLSTVRHLQELVGQETLPRVSALGWPCCLPDKHVGVDRLARAVLPQQEHMRPSTHSACCLTKAVAPGSAEQGATGRVAEVSRR